MAVATLKRSGLSGSKGRRVKAPPWKRPSDWPKLPVVNVGESKFVALHAVYDHDANFCTVSAAVTGGYTVDWGDGSAPENFASNAQANHVYNYATVPGAPTSEGFKTVIVTVTPQTASQWTTLNLALKHPQAGLIGNYATGWLDVRVAGPSLSTLVVGVGSNVVNPRTMRQFEFVGTHNFSASMQAFFSGCSGLENVILPRSFTSGILNLSSLFSNCGALTSVPFLDTAAATNLSSLFAGCLSLVSVPPLDTHACTNFSSMFSQCAKLETVPWMDTSAGNTMNNLFNGCTALKSVPALDTHLNTNFSTFYQGCSALKSVPALDMSAGVTLGSMFSQCTALKSIPAMNTSAATSMSSMFLSCASLEVIGAFDMSAVTTAPNLSSIFSGCNSLGKMGGYGARFGFTLSARLSAAELNRVYTNLGVPSGAQTLTRAANFGAAASDTSIATAKGWTIA